MKPCLTQSPVSSRPSRIPRPKLVIAGPSTRFAPPPDDLLPITSTAASARAPSPATRPGRVESIVAAIDRNTSRPSLSTSTPGASQSTGLRKCSLAVSVASSSSSTSPKAVHVDAATQTDVRMEARVARRTMTREQVAETAAAVLLVMAWLLLMRVHVDTVGERVWAVFGVSGLRQVR